MLRNHDRLLLVDHQVQVYVACRELAAEIGYIDYQREPVYHRSLCAKVRMIKRWILKARRQESHMILERHLGYLRFDQVSVEMGSCLR